MSFFVCFFFTSSTVLSSNVLGVTVTLGNDVDLISGGRCVIDEIYQGITGEITDFYVWTRLLGDKEVKAARDGFMRFPSNDLLIEWLDFRKVPSESVQLNPVSLEMECMV